MKNLTDERLVTICRWCLNYQSWLEIITGSEVIPSSDIVIAKRSETLSDPTGNNATDILDAENNFRIFEEALNTVSHDYIKPIRFYMTTCVRAQDLIEFFKERNVSINMDTFIKEYRKFINELDLLLVKHHILPER